MIDDLITLGIFFVYGVVILALAGIICLLIHVYETKSGRKVTWL